MKAKLPVHKTDRLRLKIKRAQSLLERNVLYRVGVNHGGSHIAVPQKLLNGSYVIIPLQQVAGEVLFFTASDVRNSLTLSVESNSEISAPSPGRFSGFSRNNAGCRFHPPAVCNPIFRKLPFSAPGGKTRNRSCLSAQAGPFPVCLVDSRRF
jgi:hypothetical protein